MKTCGAKCSRWCARNSVAAAAHAAVARAASPFAPNTQLFCRIKWCAFDELKIDIVRSTGWIWNLVGALHAPPAC